MTQNVINDIQISNITAQTFAATGTYIPTIGMKFCIISMVGGGGGGGGSLATGNKQCSAGGGGGSAAYAQVIFTAQEIGVSRPITIGAAGVGALGINGTSGTPSYLGSLIMPLLITQSGGGGAFGLVNDNDINGFAVGGPGGPIPITTGNVILAFVGETGQSSGYGGKADFASSGRGGATPFGNSGMEYSSIGGFYSPANSVNYGGAGAGALSANNRNAEPGGDGAPGFASILEFS